MCYCLTECKWYIIGWQEGVGVSLVDNVVDRLLCNVHRTDERRHSGVALWAGQCSWLTCADTTRSRQMEYRVNIDPTVQLCKYCNEEEVKLFNIINILRAYIARSRSELQL